MEERGIAARHHMTKKKEKMEGLFMKTKYKYVSVALALVLAVALLAGCGKDEQDPASGAAGYYAFESMTIDGEVFDASYFEDMDINYYIRLNEDHTAEVNMDTPLSATWEDGALRYTEDGEEFVNEFKLDGELLTITIADEDGMEMTLQFRRGEEPEADPNETAQGEPFVGEDGSVMAGSYTIDAEWIAFSDPYVVESIFDVYLAVSGESVYVLADEAVQEYRLADGMLVFEKDLPLDGEYDRICVDKDGILYVSGFMENFVAFEGDTQIFSHKGPDKVAMHPSGDWGISWFYGVDVKKLTLGDGTIQYEDMSFSELDSINQLFINEEHIFATGTAVATENTTIFVYDLNGNLQLTLGGTEFGEPDSLGSITAIVETANGFMALDGNMRNVCLWKSDGSFVAAVDVKELLSTSYPWLSTAVLMPDGSILTGLTQKREDKSAEELLVYRLSGF